MAKSVLIAEDHTLVREAICSVFDAQQDFEVCGDAENGKEAVEMAQVLRPDLIVLDLEMPVMNGLDVAPALKRMLPTVPIIMCSLFGGSLSEGQVRRIGIAEVVSKSDPVSLLLEKSRALVCRSAA